MIRGLMHAFKPFCAALISKFDFEIVPYVGQNALYQGKTI